MKLLRARILAKMLCLFIALFSNCGSLLAESPPSMGHFFCSNGRSGYVAISFRLLDAINAARAALKQSVPDSESYDVVGAYELLDKFVIEFGASESTEHGIGKPRGLTKRFLVNQKDLHVQQQ